MKKCTKCDEVKDVCLFNKCARNKSGLRAECKVCQSIYEQARRNLFEAEGRPIKQLIGVKKCTNCNILKPYSSFYRRGDASGTYKSQCKDCLRPALNKYKKDNPAKRAALDKKRQSSIINRTPKWLTENDLWLMEQAYQHAVDQTARHGVVFHVDHIIPLKGKYISGLHCPDNLQVLPWYENLRKGNKYTNSGIELFILETAKLNKKEQNEC